jgi:hypothetical protein
MVARREAQCPDEGRGRGKRCYAELRCGVWRCIKKFQDALRFDLSPVYVPPGEP